MKTARFLRSGSASPYEMGNTGILASVCASAMERRRDPSSDAQPGDSARATLARALNLAFDVTPSDLIAGIVTEKGIMEPPFTSSLKPYRPAQG